MGSSLALWVMIGGFSTVYLLTTDSSSLILLTGVDWRLGLGWFCFLAFVPTPHLELQLLLICCGVGADGNSCDHVYFC